VQGIGIFEMTIDESGSVSAIRTINRPLFDPPCPAFEESYRAALSKWKYKPATRDGKPVAVYLTMTVHFHF
jgi:TonB family protein